MDEIVKEFLIESREGLDRMDQDLVALEKNPSENETLASIFRAIHTIKGSSGFLGFDKLEGVAHVGENLLSKLRDGAVMFNSDLANVLLAMVDAVRYMLDQIERTDLTGDRDFSELVRTLTKWCGESEQSVESPAASLAPSLLPPKPPEIPTVVAVPVKSKDDTRLASPPPVTSHPKPRVVPQDTMPAQSALTVAAEEDPNLSHDNESSESKNAASDATVRVQVGLLDKLMNLVGELVLTRNEVLQLKKQNGDNAFVSTYQRLNLITTELQENVMKTRMQPIGNVFSKLPRLVREPIARRL